MGLVDASHVFLLLLVATLSIFLVRNRLLPGPARNEGKPAKYDKTFRVRGVPREWDLARLRSFLEERDSHLTVKSLAREIHGRSSSGTVTCRDTPTVLLIPLDLTNSSGARLQVLTLDDDFVGMTTLFAPPDKDHRIDVVAISGLGGHAFGSFKERGGEHMWLRDALPYDLKSEATEGHMARVMTYGYGSAVAESQNTDNLEDLATAFHNSLLPLASSAQRKPIIFIAHSLGGLILKQMLITLAKSEQEDDKKLLEAVYGIVFFGVPHDGMDISFLIPMVGDGPNRFLVESISRINSQILSIQQRDFHKALRAEGESEIVCFYETMQSPTAKQDESGNWAMSGPLKVLVTKSSATHCRPWEDGPEHNCAVARSHSGMVKFRPNDPEYDKACERLRGLARRAVTGRHRRQALNAKFLVPYNKNQDFVGRSNILDDLKQLLGFGQRPGAAGSRPRVALHGLGGVGKTQIALAYVYWLQEACPEVSVFWVHASNAERFRQSFASIAEECQIPGHDNPQTDVLLLVKQWLGRKENGQWLMVLDNADDEPLFFSAAGSSSIGVNKLGQYIQECNHGAVLVTTRNKKVAVRLTKSAATYTVEIRQLGEEESKQLLKTMLKEDDEVTHVLSALSSRLEHLPLALVQAAAFIQANCISIEEYLDLLDESDHTVVDLLSEDFETIGRDSEAPQAVAQTWMLSFRQIKEQDALAGDLLSLMSLFDRQGIPIPFLSHYSTQECNGGPKSNMELTKSIGLLKAFSLISEEKSGGLDMHRLVQLVMRKWLANDGKMSEFGREALSTVSQMYPIGGFENRTICSTYLPHANAVLEIDFGGLGDDGEQAKAELLHCVASYLDFEGKWSDAEKLSMAAVEIRRRVLGKKHPDALTSMAILASTYRTQGRWKEAEELGLQLIDLSNRVLGEENPNTLASMANLASTYRKQGRCKEAKELQMQELRIRRRVLGEEHPDTLTTLTYRKQGRLKEAEELGVRVMETRRSVLGEEHPDALTSIGNLASTFRTQGRWREAEELGVQVMETQERVLGEEHPRTLASMANLAATYQNQGRWKEAKELGVQVMEARKRVLGEGHPKTLTSMANLAAMYQNQGRWKEAEELGVRVMETRKKVLGEEHPDTLTSKNSLAWTWYEIGRAVEAKALMQDCIHHRQKILGQDHPHTQSSISALGRWKSTR
ncbi:tetratricopeptide repeat domain-containing protein [Hirsutella rhossiliensis]|uniref:Tetratricopeptide repeat domain-containing protein n=1 Tax=Hirsutella rhossiliensis TaxID=111463 RepID=A0A9P8MRA0_9HYPO|nr:tetratricopeptide repeat domain-containing protein [Hirsutella rhossiliensis]KAH0957777.1 tetratricopeptide repeat domain-containing protein [Hirsutella rhossiliensis]